MNNNISKKRTVIVGDSLPWLEKHRNGTLSSIVTGIPDMDEVGMNEADYINFFEKSCSLIFSKVKDSDYVIFIMTDRKHNGWIDKSFLANKMAEKAGIRLLWHKIIINRGINKVNIYRPGYSHMLCWSRNGKVGEAIPDVIERGDSLYSNGTSINAAKLAMEYLKARKISGPIIDPFCGRGTILKIANDYNLQSIGIEIDEKTARMAEKL